MTGIEASISPPALPRWFGPRARADDPAVSALIARVARGAGWADIGGEFNLNVRIEAEPPLVLRVHRPWVRRGRVAGLRRLRERLRGTQVRVARPIRTSSGDLLRVADRWAELEEFIGHVQPPAGDGSYVCLFAELGRFHTALEAVWEPGPPDPRWLPGALALVPLHWAATAGLVGDSIHRAESAMNAAEAWWSRRADLSS